jgi:hypothetical protein
MSSEADYTLTYDQAVAMLPDGDRIHTFVNPAGILIGADWDRQDILALLIGGEPELSGDQATGVGHGLVAFRGEDRHPVFIATKAAQNEPA